MLPPICKVINKPIPVTGGWMYSSLKELRKEKSVDFAVATVYHGKEFVAKQIENVWYYLLPLGRKSKLKYQPVLELYWQKVQQEFLPDIVHIHGTEFAHGLAYINACSAHNVVVSIQGLVSIYSRYYFGEIDKWDIKMGAVLDLHCTFECFPFAKGIKKQLYKVFSCIPCQATQFFNSGVLYVKECEETRRFFTSWHQNWTHSCSKKVYIDQLSLMKTCDEQTNFITSISGIYNCQILGSIQYLHTAKIVHFFNAKWNDNTLCPFFGKDIYIKVKQARGITEETKNMLLHCKEYFVSPSIPICSYDVDIWYSSIFTLLRQLHTRHEILYKLVNFTSRCIIKLSNYLIYNSLTNRGGVKKAFDFISYHNCPQSCFNEERRAA